MLIPGTQMHIVTFVFISIEIVIFFYLIIYRLARPDNPSTFPNIILITLLITYNITGGLLPDPNLPGSLFLQEIIAYGTGFITPCFFPFYVYKVFGLNKMKFHVFKGVTFFLFLPYLFFVITYATTNNLALAKNLLILPVLYALWIIYSLVVAIKDKYANLNKNQKKEAQFLFLSIAPWIGLPVIAYFDLSQAVEASITNPGFLLLLVLQLRDHVSQLKIEHQQLLESKNELLSWNTKLHEEVYKRTKELEDIIEQRTHMFVNLAHETKTPLTLINNYLDELINKNGSCEQLTLLKRSVNKLTCDMTSFFDLERFNKKIPVFDHDQICNFGEIISDDLKLFSQYAQKKNLKVRLEVAAAVFIKADPAAICRITNNLIENAIKFTEDDGIIEITLKTNDKKIIFSVNDTGIGISPKMHKKIFEPYYQLRNCKKNNQGMGLGLPIVKSIIDTLNGSIQVESNPANKRGTKISVTLNEHILEEKQPVTSKNSVPALFALSKAETVDPKEYNERLPTVFIVEDNIQMSNYLLKKLNVNYNVCTAFDGHQALQKIKSLPMLADLIISDIMMGKLDGYNFARIISNDPGYNHIPFIFLSAKCSFPDKIEGLKLGAIDFIQKPFLIDELIQKIESILKIVNKQKTLYFNSAFKSFSSNLASESSKDVFTENCQCFHLSIRERDIAKMICQGYKYKQIAEMLFISERTVTKHAQNIFQKVDVKSKMELNNKLIAKPINVCI